MARDDQRPVGSETPRRPTAVRSAHHRPVRGARRRLATGVALASALRSSRIVRFRPDDPGEPAAGSGAGAFAMPPRTVSVVVPTLNEEANVRRAVESARDDASSSSSAPPEVIVVDGGSVDNTVAEARKAGATVLASPRGRAAQCNAGARAAKGDVLVFLHADSNLPPSYRAHIDRAFEPRLGGGAR